MKKSISMPKLSILFLVLLVGSVTLAVAIGPVSIGFRTVWEIAFSQFAVLEPLLEEDWTTAQKHIVWDIRFPRVLLAAIVGAGLSLSGVTMQALLRNSLADPYILGVSSGASVGATLVIVLGFFRFFGQMAISFAAFAGALAAVLFIFMLAQVKGKVLPVRLILSGIALSAMLNALTNIIIMTAPREEGIRNALFWMMGSLGGTKWSHLWIPLIAVIGTFLFLFYQSRMLNILLMGEETAITLGVNTHQLSKMLLVVTALTTGIMVAISGAIGFVGLMVPHVTRFLVGADHKKVLPLSALLGAVFLIWADVLARTLFAPEEMPIGTITALFGGPFFIWLLRKNDYSFGGGSK
ncbi:FecCD family ABC transporter permease [Tindallia californiensis]|uniref:Iron complex transport system permease protein n=1 Tax=Tindallia californiensis TaxID=159292 RepID=A0A1H3R476_9FIRM|nr:iron ABC transporter permease [Tindallia californiensis]SDZ20642.1 iron complex transport system permease protein [Tindallia californiensis]